MAVIDGPSSWEMADPAWWFDEKQAMDHEVLRYFQEHYNHWDPTMRLEGLIGRSYRVHRCSNCGEIHRWFVFQSRTLWRYACKCAHRSRTFREKWTEVMKAFDREPQLRDLLLFFGIDALEAHGEEAEKGGQEIEQEVR